MEIGDDVSDPMVAMGGGILKGAGRGHLLHPSCASRSGRLAANVTDSPWAHHQQRAQILNGTSTRPVDVIYGDISTIGNWVWSQEALFPSQQFASRPRYQASMETPDDASEEDTQNPVFMPLPQSLGTQPQPPCYGEIDHHGERRLRRDWYEMPYRAPQECEPHVA